MRVSSQFITIRVLHPPNSTPILAHTPKMPTTGSHRRKKKKTGQRIKSQTGHEPTKQKQNRRKLKLKNTGEDLHPATKTPLMRPRRTLARRGGRRLSLYAIEAVISRVYKKIVDLKKLKKYKGFSNEVH